MKFAAFSIILTLAVFLGVSQATRCYVCSSVTDPACLDPYAGDSLHEDDCTGLDAGCSKHKAVGKVIGFDFKELNRTCSSKFDNLICDHRDWFDYEWPGFENTKVWQCSCTGDLCNSCQHVTASFTALLLSTALAYLAKKFNNSL